MIGNGSVETCTCHLLHLSGTALIPRFVVHYEWPRDEKLSQEAVTCCGAEECDADGRESVPVIPSGPFGCSVKSLHGRTGG